MPSLKRSVRLDLLSERALNFMLNIKNWSDFIRLAIEEKVERELGIVPNSSKSVETNIDDSIFGELKSVLDEIKFHSLKNNSQPSNDDAVTSINEKLSLIIKAFGEFKNVQSPKVNEDAIFISLEDMEKRLMSRMKLYSDQIVQSISSVSGRVEENDLKLVENNEKPEITEFEKTLASGMSNFSFTKKK